MQYGHAVVRYDKSTDEYIIESRTEICRTNNLYIMQQAFEKAVDEEIRETIKKIAEERNMNRVLGCDNDLMCDECRRLGLDQGCRNCLTHIREKDLYKWTEKPVLQSTAGGTNENS